ncbi:laminin subunit alpha-like, partial [Cherax quadricarinatus]
MLLHSVILLIVGIFECQCQATTYGTSRTKHQSHPSSNAWSGSTRYAHSRTSVSSSSRYGSYRPLDVYRSQYGTYVHLRNHSTLIPSSVQHPESSTTSWTLNNTRQYESSGRHTYSGSDDHIRRQEGTSHNYGRTVATQISTVPPLIESSIGLTHYTTLNRHGQGRSHHPITYPPPQGSLYRRFGKKGQRIAGEGYGEAYLEWSEYGVGCTCDECGTRNCQHFSGVCECYGNVIGDQCERCAPDHWGFASCQGCQPCYCGIASLRSQCDEGTGQCECSSGVTGQRCDQCMPGFWNYTQYGCQECTCREGFSVGVGCDPRTGQCQCLPGVIGTNCEGCPYRWVLVDGVGCHECEECVHALLDTTDQLSWLIQPTITEFETAAYSYFLHQRLGVINSTVFELRPQVNLMDLTEAETSTLQDPLSVIVREAQALSAH